MDMELSVLYVKPMRTATGSHKIGEGVESFVLSVYRDVQARTRRDDTFDCVLDTHTVATRVWKIISFHE